MSAGEYCNREVIVVEKAEPVRVAIELMRNEHVGNVVVVERRSGKMKPLGILTDRDIVVELLAKNVDLGSVTIGDVMSLELVTVREDTKLLDTISVMRAKGIRRVPIVDHEGYLVGVLAVDDVLGLIAEQMSDIAGLIAHEQDRERDKFA